MSNIDLIEDLNNTLFKIGEYLEDGTLKNLIRITEKVLENSSKFNVEISQACDEDNKCYAKLKVSDNNNNEIFKLIYKVDEKNKEEKEIIYNIDNIIILKIEIKRGNIQTKYHPTKPNSKMIDFYLERIMDNLRQQNSYFFF